MPGDAHDAAAELTVEPHAPDILELTVAATRGSTHDVAVRLTDTLGHRAVVEIVNPEGLLFHSGRARIGAAGDESNRQALDTVSVNTSVAGQDRITVRVTLLNDDGTVWLSMDETLVLAETTEAAGPKRVPVVLESSDGRRVVEYMTPDEALQRGLTISEPSTAEVGAAEPDGA